MTQTKASPHFNAVGPMEVKLWEINHVVFCLDDDGDDNESRAEGDEDENNYGRCAGQMLLKRVDYPHITVNGNHQDGH